MLLLLQAARTGALVAPVARRAPATGTAARRGHPLAGPRRAPARSSVRRHACLVQIEGDGSRQQIECNDGKAEYLRDRNDGAAGSLRDRAYASTRRTLRNIFLPVAVNEEYLAYTRWRCVQRLLSATVNVFGVQAMVMAVGLRDARAVAAGGAVVGAAAAVDWVLKDALGKVTRLGWAARMGREFDGDAKRWRFRSSLLYATGNGLQIATFAFPALFLALATAANCLKQVSMLTSTATRSAIYRSFAATETTNNLGDVTAKGEAQIAVVDLCGLLIGLAASKKLGVASTQANPRMLVAIYGSLSLLEICAMYKEIACVVFRQLNFERATLVIDAYVETGVCPSPRDVARRERILRRPQTPRSRVLKPLAKVATTVSRADLNRHVALAATDDFLIVDGAVILRDGAGDDVVLDALHARARTLRFGADALVEARAGGGALREAVRAAGWSTQSFMFPEVLVRADWGDEAKS